MDTKPGTSGIPGETDVVFVKAFPYLYQAINSDTCDLQNVCRSCLSVNNETLYSLLKDEKPNISDMFSKVTSIQVNEEDGLPTSICQTCHQEVLRCVKFKTKCLDSDNTLRAMLEGSFQSLDDYNYASSDCDLKDNLEKKLEETDLKNELEEVSENNENYLESLCDAMSSDDEALCIVRENTKHLNFVIVDKGKQNGLSKKKQNKGKLSKVPKQNEHLILCPHCPKKYVQNKSLRAHIHRHHKEPKAAHDCRQCAAKFTCDEDLKVHQSLHNNDSVWKCNRCHKEFSVKAGLRRHLKIHMSSKRHSCDVCKKRFAEHSAMLRHRVVHFHCGLRYRCPYCEKRFAERLALEKHRALHEAEGGAEGGMEGGADGSARPGFACACGKRFASRRLLVSHSLVHTDDKPYACKYCDKRYRSANARNTHHRTHTGHTLVCSVCGKTFLKVEYLNIHMRLHTGERPYSCSQCDSKFASSRVLRNHELKHTGERCSCSICGKSLAHSSLAVHMRLHTGVRPFACSLCPRRFNNATYLREHMRLHTGERPLECAKCTQTFSTKAHLTKHVRACDGRQRTK